MTGEPDALNTTAAEATRTTVGSVERFPTPIAARAEQDQQKTFMVRTSGSASLQSHLKVTVPSTTAEAMAMNASIKERAAAAAAAAAKTAAAAAKTAAIAAAPAAPAFLRPPLKFPKRGREAPAAGRDRGGATRNAALSGDKKPPAAGAAEQPRAQGVMVVTPNARSKAIQMRVPRTTAECIELNKAIRERYPGEPQAGAAAKSGSAAAGATTTTSANNAVNESYSRRWRNPPAPGAGPGRGRDLRWGRAAGAERDAYGRQGAGLSSPEAAGYGELGYGTAEEPDFDRIIARLHSAMRWEQIVRVWEVRQGRGRAGGRGGGLGRRLEQ